MIWTLALSLAVVAYLVYLIKVIFPNFFANRNYKQILIAGVTFLGGLYFFLDFVLPPKLPLTLGGYEFSKYNQEISLGFIAVGAMAFALGLFNLLYVHGSKIIFWKKGAVNSVALLSSLFLMMLFTSNEWLAFEEVNDKAEGIRTLAEFSRKIESDAKEKIATEKSPEERIVLLKEHVRAVLDDTQGRLSAAGADLPKIIQDGINEQSKGINRDIGSKLSVNSLGSLTPKLMKLAGDRQQLEDYFYKKSSTKMLYDYLYEGLFVPLGSAMFALLGFYIISAGYRAFRVRSVESGLMMMAAVIVMLGQIPFYIYVSEALPDIRLWLLEYPSAAAFRAIKFGAAIAGLYMAIRMWLSIESSSFIENKKTGGGDK
jgi:ABC-type multidrug transport system fused ATPase/permease subunit